MARPVASDLPASSCRPGRRDEGAVRSEHPPSWPRRSADPEHLGPLRPPPGPWLRRITRLGLSLHAEEPSPCLSLSLTFCRAHHPGRLGGHLRESPLWLGRWPGWVPAPSPLRGHSLRSPGCVTVCWGDTVMQQLSKSRGLRMGLPARVSCSLGLLVPPWALTERGRGASGPVSPAPD